MVEDNAYAPRQIQQVLKGRLAPSGHLTFRGQATRRTDARIGV